MKILHLFISPGHNFFGHHGQPAGKSPILSVNEIRCVAGRGIEGDRFFDHKENYKGQITFFAMEVFLALCEKFQITGLDASVFRRNVITQGVDLNTLIGQPFEIQGVKFQGIEECSPCYWMNQAVTEGAEKFLKGLGGLRAHILSDGIIRKQIQ